MLKRKKRAQTKAPEPLATLTPEELELIARRELAVRASAELVRNAQAAVQNAAAMQEAALLAYRLAVDDVRSAHSIAPTRFNVDYDTGNVTEAPQANEAA